MLIKAKTLTGYKLNSRDGEIGKVKELYFDDHHWVVRYLVADTENWLTGRQVLISPYLLVAVVKAEHHITVDLTRKQIEESPSLDTDKPVSQQFEEAFSGYFGLPKYWNRADVSGAHPAIERDREKWMEYPQSQRSWDPHLRSTRAVEKHHLQALDGELGHVEDFIIDDETWAIRYLVVATRNWWPGKKVLVSPQWIERVSWSESKVFINLFRDAIKRAPEYTEASLLTRDYETGLHRHYDRQGYWVAEPGALVALQLITRGLADATL